MDQLLDQIGGNIKKYREIKDITQQELSKICRMHRNYIGSIEKGERNITVLSLAKIAQGLNIPVEHLLK